MTKKSKKLFLSILICIFFTLPLTPKNLVANELGGFFEGAGAFKFGNEKAVKNNYNFLETRFQLKANYFPEFLEDNEGELFFKGEVLGDGYDERVYAYIRESNISMVIYDLIDLKMGRQILTWGTGDLLFINDQFPKDYISFFIGRGTEYLKVPSDALKISYWSKYFAIDLVGTLFEPNKSLNGERLSFYNPFTGEIEGSSMSLNYERPSSNPKNIESSLRLSRTFGSVEGALYFFSGFYKDPVGVLNPISMSLFYPRMNSYGFSLRGPFLGGIANFEAGFLESRDDINGENPLITNSEVRYLIGIEEDLGGDTKLGLQFYVEQMLSYGKYENGVPLGAEKRDEFRSLLTLRLSKFFLAQTLHAGFILFYGLNEDDLYFRPRVSYNFTDNFKLSLGANIFDGANDHTNFGQLQGNNNLFLGARYSF
ncbi:MAG: hypothetical protein KAT46_02540 [Deltaproteobacteria bacterium]|nr:hypothetical protein [Deltaproteobacteria bacterium]